jgi:hypothetical protein
MVNRSGNEFFNLRRAKPGDGGGGGAIATPQPRKSDDYIRSAPDALRAQTATLRDWSTTPTFCVCSSIILPRARQQRQLASSMNPAISAPRSGWSG